MDNGTRTDGRDPGCKNRQDGFERNPGPGPRCTVRGTGGDNVPQGTDKRDVICGLGGDDLHRLQGESGRDATQQ